MILNSHIQLRGINKPLMVSRASAEHIKAIFEDDSKSRDFVISVGNQSFTKGDIKFVDIQNDRRGGEENDKDMTEFYAEERRDYKNTSEKTPEIKALSTTFFEYVYQISCGEKPDSESLCKVIDIQLSFFRQNPKRTLCDMNLLKPLVKMDKSKYGHFQSGGLALAERAIFRDMQLSGQLTAHQ